MKLSEQIRDFKQSLYDYPASAENVRDQVGILAENIERLAEATEAITEYLYQNNGQNIRV